MSNPKGIVIGMGCRGQVWAKCVGECGTLSGIVDINPEALDKAAKELGLDKSQQFTSIEEAAKQLNAGFAIIVSPNKLHAQNVDECLEAGLHVLVEKPFVIDSQDGLRLIQKAKSKGLHIMVAQNIRYSKGFVTLGKVIKEKQVGEPASVHIHYGLLRKTVGPGSTPLLLNMSIHHFDAVRAVFSDTPRYCMAKYWSPDWVDTNDPTMVEAIYEFADGLIFSYSGSYASKGQRTPGSGIWRIDCSEGQINYSDDGKNTKVTIIRPDSDIIENVPIIGEDSSWGGMDILLEKLLVTITTNTKAETDAEDNMRSLAMIFAAKKSARTGEQIDLREFWQE